MIPQVFLVPGFQDMHLQDVLARRDNVTRPWSAYLATEIVLQAKPFNRLSIWAYIAFAFIVFAVSTVVGYMTYTCCYSAKRRYYGTETKAARRIGATRLNSTKRNGTHWIRGGRYRFGETKGKVIAKDEERRGVNEKDGLERFRIESIVLELKKRGFNPKPSESEENIIQYHSSISHSSHTNTLEHPYEVENQYLTSPPLAYTNERSAAYIPFYLPPPSSPTPAYKEFLERQKQFYGGKQMSHSPVSPSPSLFPDRSPPNLFKASIISPSQKPKKNHKRVRLATAKKGADQFTGAYDSNNIRFASPLNPFMTPYTTFRWNDPKLSPVAGSIITSSPTRDSDDYQATPSSSSNKKPARLLSPQQVGESGGHGHAYREKDNLHPISRADFGQQDNWF